MFPRSNDVEIRDKTGQTRVRPKRKAAQSSSLAKRDIRTPVGWLPLRAEQRTIKQSKQKKPIKVWQEEKRTLRREVPIRGRLPQLRTCR